jgi:hypothetical protein
MSRRPRRWNRSPVPSAGAPKIWRMLLMLFIVGLIYTQARDPHNWQWLGNAQSAELGKPAAQPEPAAHPAPPPPQVVKPGPTDEDEWDKKEIKDSLAVINDKTAIQPVEMPAYWNMIRWSLAQSLPDMQKRASQVPMRHLWDNPEDYRGKLIRLDLHVRRIERLEAKGENSAGVAEVYEAWAGTDDAKGQPYCVVFPDLPAGMQTGDVQLDGAFVGYFHKWLWYQPGVGKARNAPLLIGRIQLIPKPIVKAAPLTKDPLFPWIAGGVGVMVAVIVVLVIRSPRVSPVIAPQNRDEETALAFLQNVDRDLANTPPKEATEKEPIQM